MFARRLVIMRRHMVALGASVVVHVALLAWVRPVVSPARPPAPETFAVELVEIETVRDEPIAPRAGDEAEREEPAASSAPPPIARRVRPRLAAPRIVDTGTVAVAEVPEPPVEPEAPREVAAAPVVEPRPAAVGSDGAGRGSARSGAGTPGPRDHSSYGAEIVRIVLAEIERDPVRGIRPTDTIQVLLEVLPNGELAWTRDGRFGFARVLRSSLGRTRTRQVLRRIERASYRFPVHPAGFARRRYVVDVTVNFSKHAT